jgi:hypothetical protein
VTMISDNQRISVSKLLYRNLRMAYSDKRYKLKPEILRIHPSRF